jgi:hypothetical protein
VTRSIGSGYGYSHGYDGQMSDPQAGMPLTGNAPLGLGPPQGMPLTGIAPWSPRYAKSRAGAYDFDFKSMISTRAWF